MITHGTDHVQSVTTESQQYDPDTGMTLTTDYTVSDGLTKREHFAILAMQGILSHSFGSGNPEDCAICALQNADALIKELNDENTTT